MIHKNIELSDEVLMAISSEPTLLRWLSELQNSAIENEKKLRWAVKSGPLSFVSAYRNSWNYGYSSDSDMYDATPSDGIEVLEEGIYEIEAAQRGDGSSNSFVALSIDGDAAELRGRPNSQTYNDHTETLDDFSVAGYIGPLYAGDLVCAGNSMTGAGLTFSSNGFDGFVKIKRLGSL